MLEISANEQCKAYQQFCGKKVQQFVFIGLLTCALNQPYLSLKSFVGCPKGRCLGCAFRSVS
jgi:hypothetical protein